VFIASLYYYFRNPFRAAKIFRRDHTVESPPISKVFGFGLIFSVPSVSQCLRGGFCFACGSAALR